MNLILLSGHTTAISRYKMHITNTNARCRLKMIQDTVCMHCIYLNSLLLQNMVFKMWGEGHFCTVNFIWGGGGNFEFWT